MVVVRDEARAPRALVGDAPALLACPVDLCTVHMKSVHAPATAPSVPACTLRAEGGDSWHLAQGGLGAIGQDGGVDHVVHAAKSLHLHDLYACGTCSMLGPSWLGDLM